ncbi:hypothetical protein TNCV_1618501 [Trichonephila clavipes]|nr:hypothetical protein TNCV_1618501 [Trichonephila clavipes]
MSSWGCDSPVVKVSDHSRHVTSSRPSTIKDPPCREAVHVKSVESSNVLPLRCTRRRANSVEARSPQVEWRRNSDKGDTTIDVTWPSFKITNFLTNSPHEVFQGDDQQSIMPNHPQGRLKQFCHPGQKWKISPLSLKQKNFN